MWTGNSLGVVCTCSVGRGGKEGGRGGGGGGGIVGEVEEEGERGERGKGERMGGGRSMHNYHLHDFVIPGVIIASLISSPRPSASCSLVVSRPHPDFCCFQ